MSKRKILFCGFRHSHIFSLYKAVAASSDWEIAGCIESDPQARSDAEAVLGIRFSDIPYEKWLTSDIDVVAIGNAYGLRYRDILPALQAGKHILADKPLCTDLKQLAQIRKLSEEKNLKIGCMLDLRDAPQVQLAKQYLESGRLGQVQTVSFNGQHCLNYGQRPMWYFEPGMHGGTINDLAIHGIDLVRIMTGQEFAKIDAARVWNAYATEQTHFKDCAQFMARLEKGAGVMADISYSAPYASPALPFYWEFRFWCDKGVLTFSATAPTVTVYIQDDPTSVILKDNAPLYSYLSDFTQELEQDTRTVTENVLRSTKTALLLQSFADQEA